MKFSEFNRPKNEFETEAEMHVEETRRARFVRVEETRGRAQKDAAQRSSPERFLEIN